MKTYTIRPLKWKCNCDDLHVAKVAIGYYAIDEDGAGMFDVELDNGMVIQQLGQSDTIAAALATAGLTPERWMKEVGNE